MTEPTLEDRVTALEKRMLEIERLLTSMERSTNWERTIGKFRDDPGFDELVRPGRKYRESQREKVDD